MLYTSKQARITYHTIPEMSRTDGKKIVGLAFAGIAGAIGIGQIYLPYIADRDKLRGLFEEEDMPAQAKREMDMIMRAEMAAVEARQQGSGSGNGSGQSQGEKKIGAGSMWSSFRRKE